MGRLTDNDKNFGPFTFAKVNWNHIRIIFSSGGDEETATNNNLTIYMFGYVLRVALPNLISDFRREHKSVLNGKPIEYSEIHPNEYGFCLHEGFLQFFYGPQTNDSITTKSKGYFLPWTQWRFVRHSVYDEFGHHFYIEFNKHIPHEILKLCPNRSFKFKDYDGEEIIAKTYIEEREWLFGTGWFKWLSWFRKPMVRRDLNLEFSSEVGPAKGSWKGGTIGHSIDMLPNEKHEQAFKRYCKKEHKHRGTKYKLTYVGKI